MRTSRGPPELEQYRETVLCTFLGVEKGVYATLLGVEKKTLATPDKIPPWYRETGLCYFITSPSLTIKRSVLATLSQDLPCVWISPTASLMPTLSRHCLQVHDTGYSTFYTTQSVGMRGEVQWCKLPLSNGLFQTKGL